MTNRNKIAVSLCFALCATLFADPGVSTATKIGHDVPNATAIEKVRPVVDGPSSVEAEAIASQPAARQRVVDHLVDRRYCQVSERRPDGDVREGKPLCKTIEFSRREINGDLVVIGKGIRVAGKHCTEFTAAFHCSPDEEDCQGTIDDGTIARKATLSLSTENQVTLSFEKSGSPNTKMNGRYEIHYQVNDIDYARKYLTFVKGGGAIKYKYGKQDSTEIRQLRNGYYYGLSDKCRDIVVGKQQLKNGGWRVYIGGLGDKYCDNAAMSVYFAPGQTEAKGFLLQKVGDGYEEGHGYREGYAVELYDPAEPTVILGEDSEIRVRLPDSGRTVTLTPNDIKNLNLGSGAPQTSQRAFR